MDDKRRVPRFHINREFKNVEEFIREYALNVSLGGCFIRTNEVIPVGSEVQLKFSVIVDDFETIEGVGRVVRVSPPGPGREPGVGVVFTSLTDTSRDVLVRLFLRENNPDACPKSNSEPESDTSSGAEADPEAESA